MHKNRLWLIFLILFGLATAYYSAIGVHALTTYVRQSKATVPLEVDWSYRKIGSETYAPVATFAFAVDQSTVEGETQLSRPLFRNAMAADQVLEDLEKQSWQVWYNPAYPQQATVERRFPIKQALSATAMLGLFLYFIFLGYYVRRM